MVGKVAVVTGGNKGLGLEAVRQLCQRLTGEGDVVILTSRNKDLGHEAVETLKKEGLQPVYHQLDITSQEDIQRFRDHLVDTYQGGLDILVNNAGIAYKNASTAPFAEQARVTVDTNFFGTLHVCQALFPLLRPGARVVNVSSSCGHLSKISGAEPAAAKLRAQLSSPQLTVPELEQLMKNFVELAQTGDHVAGGWPDSAYKVSKVGVSALSILQQRALDQQERPGEDIAVNHVHPGYVDTDMTSHKGHWPVSRGVLPILFAATLPPDTKIKGEYIWEDSTVTSWTKEDVHLYY